MAEDIVQWPYDADPMANNEVSEGTRIMAANENDEDKMASVTVKQLADKAAERVEYTGIERPEPFDGGDTEEEALLVPDGPSGENQVADVVSGKWYDFGAGAVQASSSNRWRAYWDGSSWSLVDMGELPQTPVASEVQLGNHEAVESDAVARQTMLNEKFVLNGEKATGKNLFNKDTIRDGLWLNTTTGHIEPVNSGWKISQYIPVKAGIPYFMSGGSNPVYRIAIFKNVGDTIPVQYVTSQQMIIPEIDGFAVIQAAHLSAGDFSDTIQFEQNNQATAYESYQGTEVEEIYEKFLPESVKNPPTGGVVEEGDTRLIDGNNVFEAFNPINSTLNSIVTRRNFFDKNAVVDGRMISANEATNPGRAFLRTVAGWAGSPHIELEPGQYKILGITIGSNTLFAGLFDNKSTGEGSRIYDNIVDVTGEESKFLVFSVKSPNFEADINQIQVKRLDDNDEYVPFDSLSIKESALPENSSQGDSGRMQVYIGPQEVRVRSAYDDTNDLVQEYQYQNIPSTNGVFSGSRTYLLPKSVGLAGDILTYQVHRYSDSISPMGSDHYWFVFGQHGYLVARFTVTGNPFQIGQEVTDNLGRQYTVVHVNGAYIYAAPRIIVDEVNKTIERDWSNGATAPTSVRLTSGSTEYSVTSQLNYQIKPMGQMNLQKILIDGREITEQGLFYGDDVELVDSFTFVDPATAEFNGITSMSGAALAVITQSYYFKGKSVYLTHNLDMRKWNPFIKYHGIQPIGLIPDGDYKPYIMYPKVLPKTASGKTDVDWNYPTDVSAGTDPYAQSFFKAIPEDVVDPNDLPDRTIQFLQNTAGDFKIGFASGFDLETGLASKENRPQYTDEVFALNWSLNRKTYWRAMTGSKFPDGVLPESFLGQFNAYFAYYKPNVDNQCFVVHSKDTSYIYIHTQAVFDKLKIDVDGIEGKRLEIVEDKAVELLTDRVVNGQVFVKTSNADANYIVLKTV